MMPPSRSKGAVGSVVAVLVVFALCAPGALARPVSKDEAAAAVAGWMKLTGRASLAFESRTVKEILTCKDSSGASLCYVVSLKPAGFVILPVDDLVEPVLCFSSTGAYWPDSNPLAPAVMHDVTTRMAATHGPKAAEAQAEQKEAQRKWAQIRAASTGGGSAARSNGSDARVEPLFESQWAQSSVRTGYCFNYFTPNHNFCGCLATAMAQLMRFHQYPKTPYVSAAPAPLRGGDGRGGPYHWEDMPLDPCDATDAQRRAIGALCYDAGITLDMQYSSTGSSAHFAAISGALKKVFLYSNAVCSGRESIVGKGLDGMINPNLDAGYPTLLAIKLSMDAGHAIAVDGYGFDLGTIYHHFNMGWGGADDVWYNLPRYDDGRYNWASYCIYNVFPSGSGEIISGRVTDRAGAPISGATVQAAGIYGNRYNGSTTTNDRGIFAFAKVPSASSYTLTARMDGYTFSSQNVATTTSDDYSGISGNVWGADFIGTSNSRSGR